MSDEPEIDIDMFISLVKERPVLWDKKLKLYKKRSATDRAWREIIRALNPTSNTNKSSAEKQAFEIHIRKKWRYLRDQYVVELSKIPRTLEDTFTPKWPYYKALRFLKGVIRRRPGIKERKIRRSSSNTSVEQNDDQSDMATSYQVEYDSADPLEETDEKPSRNKVQYISSGNSIINDEHLEVTRTDTDDNDEHMYFFKSLLPHVREIPRRRLLAFRSSIQAVVEDFAYSTEPSSHFHQQPVKDKKSFYNI